MAKTKAIQRYPERAANVPVTQKMLYAVRDELKSEIKASEAKAEARSHALAGQIHQIMILVEEQNAKNNIVLDGLTNLFERQERIEIKMDRFEAKK